MCVYVCVLRGVGGGRAGEGKRKMRTESHSTLFKILSSLALPPSPAPPTLLVWEIKEEQAEILLRFRFRFRFS